MTLLKLCDLSVRLGGRSVLDRVSLEVGAGELVGLVGPNGAGKTTLLRAAMGLVPATGESSLAAMEPRARARHAAFLPQSREIAWPVAVEDLVALGRLPHGGGGPADRAAVDAALDRMDLGAHRHRAATGLSGGEQARVLIARALAQEAPLLMADEPAAGLDPAHAISAMATFRALAAEGRGLVVTIHDLGLAARHCTRIVAMSEGRIVASGPPREVLDATHMRRIFSVTSFSAEAAGGPVFQPLDLVDREGG
ncbi:ABC transporter ATP-binding protein [Palleronia sp. LCG004]|uniref:ABC transporter ATP-binding protein n=1 Tax=Palleronia sp. LCG004 TaxID=3079304 RepID=UPI002941F84C|nr:ABC transporter ATP-binding protein [Palleronia sp. LCG004]WOI58376.1 ABC transporter ATP-binding protein [Palleronia sp. LCG004]